MKILRSEEIKRIRGREVLEEAVKLLDRMRIAPDQGAHATGEHVAVNIQPSWSEDHKKIQVLITCYPFGKHSVDWMELLLFIHPEKSEEITGLIRLDQDGQGTLSNLSPKAYRPSGYIQWGESGESIPLRWDSPWCRVYSTKDESIQITANGEENGTLVVAAETRDARMAGRTVQIGISDRHNANIRRTAKLTLEPAREVKGLWKGRWEYHPGHGMAADCEEENELIFAVVPNLE